MSQADAESFIDLVEADAAFRSDIANASGYIAKRQVVKAKMDYMGWSITAEDMQDVLEENGTTLTNTQATNMANIPVTATDFFVACWIWFVGI